MAMSDAQEYDPFAAFDDVVAGTDAGPVPDLAVKRRDTPVARGMTMSPDALPEGIDVEPGWIAYRYEDCSRILRDAKTFTSTGYDATIGMVMGHMILGMDDPEHRTPPQPGGRTPSASGRWPAGSPSSSRPIIDEQIDRFAADGAGRPGAPADLRVPGAGHRAPAGPARGGLPAVPALVRRAHRPGGRHRPRASPPRESLRDYFAGIVAERRAHPAEDVISDLVSAEVDGEQLTRRGHLLLPPPAPAGGSRDHVPLVGQPALPAAHPPRPARGGAQPTGRCSPRPSRRGCAASRRCSPSTAPPPARSSSAGVTIGPGESITPHIGSANHDETRWDDPESLRHLPARRPPHRIRARPAHVPGHAPGPARDPRAAQRVLDRLPGLALEPGDADPHIRGDVFRSPTSLPVTFPPPTP